jgi:hypothetical protein
VPDLLALRLAQLFQQPTNRMLAQLSIVKLRLSLAPADPTYDALLTSAIAAVSSRFDRETNRTLARTVNATHEFNPLDTELLVPCYPIESVQKFELKFTEAGGWLEQPEVQYLIRHSCIISLNSPFSIQPSAFAGSHIPAATSSPAPRSPLPAPRFPPTLKPPPSKKSRTGSKPAITSA